MYVCIYMYIYIYDGSPGTVKSGSEGRAEKLEATAEIQAGRDVDGLSRSTAVRAGLGDRCKRQVCTG